MINKLALGTAQFGLGYGIANTLGQVDISSAKTILELASSRGISTLDTAIAYGDSEQVLGKIGTSRWRIISKLPEVPYEISNCCSWVESKIESSLQRLGTNKIHGFLLHHPAQLSEGRGGDILRGLKNARLNGLVEKIGVSIYSPQELDTLPLSDLDLVQAPLNILDRRMLVSGAARRLKDRGIELHVRSIFLQGLLLLSPEKRPNKFSRWANVWNIWDSWPSRHGYTALEACLGFALGIEEVDRIVVGVDSYDHLQEILTASNTVLASLPTWPDYIDEDLINPSHWRNL